jgi:hypothetical protein
VGFDEVLQHAPRAVTAVSPSEITVPPLFALVCVISVTAVVVTVASFVTLRTISFPLFQFAT